ncbi:putative glucose oxidase [Aspergillus campestris IBT 28561]|uniref:glucose oxidase n=1 Tax=Aspergillus campestris (strain IBT 28561) TaxID=1392248 RepID=A0A2I1DDP9_ASPC2|nr:putative glucose oxidase [Aspergillus campestris IBT 28561]PKY08003.1 putative glucose oxidase [Aspergillus campestris IBT 28561]
MLLLAATIAAQYDYIIVGGGTSGLVVAHRLSEDPKTSVLVHEAGPSVFDNINVTDINRLNYTYDSSIDWAYQTVPQTYGGRTQVLRAGKALGGTSVMNGAAYARAEVAQIDSWQEIGNDGWSWQNLFPYYFKSENIRLPNQTQIGAGVSIDPKYHGFSGPLSVGFFDLHKGDHDLTAVFNRTLGSMGIPSNPDLNSGHMRGFTIHPSTVDVANVRNDAARAYYWPYAKRPNVHVKLNTLINRIVWGDRDKGGNERDLTATGVEINKGRGKGRVIHARKEVILAAGALGSPAILERSGAGNPSILRKLNIPVHINLPSVGENLQDQLNTSIVVSTKAPVTGTRTVAFASASDIFGSSVESVAASTRSQLVQYANDTAKASHGAMKAEDLLRMFEIQHDHIFSQNLPAAEFVFLLKGDQSIHTGYWGLLPFARGNSHVVSADPTIPPVVNPNYGMLDWDVQIQIAMSKFLRKMYKTGEFSDIIADESLPGLSVVPEDASDETWATWIGEQYTPNYHVVGTTSMLPRSMGGVVDSRLKVYGTTNVRVVDASIQPLQLCGHPMANLYAIAEWVSDMIKEDAADQGGSD